MVGIKGVLIQFLLCTGHVTLAVVYVNKGSVDVLTCPFRSDSKQVISWFGPPNYTRYSLGIQIDTTLSFHEKLEIIGDTDNREYNLQISNITQRDIGQYKCSGISSGTTQTTKYDVMFSELPSPDLKMEQTPSGQVDNGTTVLFKCKVFGGKPVANISWQCGGYFDEVYESFTLNASSSIKLTVSKSDNNRRCNCIASHPGWSTDKSEYILLDVAYAPDDNLAIQQNPPGGIITGITITLTCTVSGGNPLATLEWNCTGTYIGQNIGNISSYSVSFVVNKTFNNKICTCSASQPLSSHSSFVHHSLNIYYIPERIPSIQQMPSGGILTGSKVTLTCFVDGGNPLAILSWNCSGIFDKKTNGNTASYSVTFTVNKTDNDRACACQATHNISSYNHVVQHNIVVFYPPSQNPTISQEPPGGIKTGQNVKLTCIVSGGNPLATLIWNCTGNNKNNTTGTTALYSVDFPVDKSYNKKICTCSSEHPDKSYNYTVQHELIVFYSPGKPNVIDTPKMPWLEGNKTYLRCIYEEGNPVTSIRWMRENIVRPGYNTSIFDLGIVTKDDNNATMKCVVFNNYGEMESEVLYLNIEYIPEIQIEKTTVVTVEGKNATNMCKAKGNPVPLVSWFSIKTEFSTPTPSESFLSIVDIDRGRDGNYTCRAVSKSAKYGNLTSLEESKVIVYYPPDVIVRKTLTDITEDTNLTMSCHANGKPTNYTYTWKHTFGEFDIRTFPSNESTLTIQRLSYQDVGNYACMVNNGITDRQGILNKSNYTAVDVKFSPVFVHYDKVITKKSGDNVTLAVDFISFPDIGKSIKWRNGTESSNLVNSSSLFMTLEKRLVETKLHDVSVDFKKYAYRSALHLSNFDENLEGNFNIVVNNSVGVNNLTLSVVLSDRPDPPTIFSARVIGSTDITLTWRGGSNGGNTQTFVITYWKDGSVIRKYAMIPEKEDKPLDYDFDILDLTPSTTYFFSIKSTNAVGDSPDVNNTIVLSTKNIPDSDSSIVGPVGGAVGGIAAAALIVIPFIVFFKRRRAASRSKCDAKHLTFKSTEEDEADVGLKDNVLYESAGEHFNATPGPNGDLYGIVRKDKSKNKDNGQIQETTLYSDIKKTTTISTEGKEHANAGTTNTGKSKQKGKRSEQKERHEDVYENISEQKTTKNRNKDGLVYADLIFKDTENRKFIIRGLENKTDYADIDLNLKADPLPSDESENEGDEGNKEK